MDGPEDANGFASVKIDYLDQMAEELQKIQIKHDALRDPDISWGYLKGMIPVLFFVLLGQLESGFLVIGVGGAFVLAFALFLQLVERSGIRTDRLRLTNQIQALRGDIGWCLEQWEVESRKISDRQRQQADRQRQQSEAALVARMAPLAFGLRQEVAIFGPAISFVGADWDDPSWVDWAPSTTTAPTLRLGTLTFYDTDAARLLGPVVDSMTFKLPALISMHNGRGLLFSTSIDARIDAIGAVQSTITRLLATLPPGRLYLTFIDPVGLGNNVSMFMALRDYLDRLVNTRAWSEPDAIEQRLDELTERVEDIIQRRIPDPEESIEDYNARAGDLAEPYRVVVVFDFPRNFTDAAARRLASIAHNGPRCGVYPIVVRMQEQEPPYRFDLEELERAMVCIDETDGRFVWRDELFAQATLTLDQAAPADLTSQIIAAFGAPAKAAERVEIPLAQLLALEGLSETTRWTYSSIDGIRIPLGIDGNGRLVSLAIDKEESAGSAQHGLLAGATGMGKSNLLHVMITAGALTYSPDELQFYLVDLKAGVEFNAYVKFGLPHATVIAVDDDPDYGLSVLEGLDAERRSRGDLFRNTGVSDIAGYRHKTGSALPRILLIIDEFQVLFPSDNPAIANRAAAILDSLARLGRGPGIHVLLCSQNIGHGDTLSPKTTDQMRIRIALGCSEADARRVLTDDNLAPSRFTRKGQALYNPNGGLKDSNREFQVALYESADLAQLQQLIQARRNTDHHWKNFPRPRVFVGSDPAHLPDCAPLINLLETSPQPQSLGILSAWLGEPIAMRPPIAIQFQPEGGSHFLLITRDEEQSMGLMVAAMLAIAAQRGPEQAAFLVLDLTRPDTHWADVVQILADGLPHTVQVGKSRHIPDQLETLDALLAERITADRALPLHVYWVILGLHKARALHEGDSYGFSSINETSPPARWLKLLRQGPELGMHVLAWCDSVRNLQGVGRSAIAEMRLRVAGLMDDGDSTQFIDSTVAAHLKPNRLIFVHKDDPESLTTFRPYALPDSGWLAAILSRMKGQQS